LSTGATTTTQFSFGPVANDALRDFHINDAYKRRVAWAWNDNSMVTDKTNNVLNLMVITGKIKKDGTLKLRKPVQLTNVQPPFTSNFDTAVAINRKNPKNIIVSYTLLNYNNLSSPVGATINTCRAISFDGGKTWPSPFDGITSQPYNGLTNIQPSGYATISADTTGVKSDKYGNIWYCANSVFDNVGNVIYQAYFIVSTDEGVTYEPVYTIPLPTQFPVGTSLADFPQYCFGGDGQGNYGLWFQTTFYNLLTGDAWPTVGFIPIFGPGQWGTLTSTPPIQYVRLAGLVNSFGEANLTASSDGRVWFQGVMPVSLGDNDSTVCPFNYVQPILTLFKSPGAIDENYAGAWDYATSNFVQDNTISPTPLAVISQPIGGFISGPQCILYDEKRQAIYALQAVRTPDNSQNMRIFFIISRDNTQTWSNSIDISTTIFGNRGFPSMALDEETGDLVFGWYDGRNDPTYKFVEYFGAIIKAKKLDKWVNNIPLSNPTYIVPSSAITTKQLSSKKVTTESDDKIVNIERLKRLKSRKFSIDGLK
jgi:hypothetical protein